MTRREGLPAAIFTMEEAASRLRISRRKLQDMVKLHPFYALNGAKKLFSEAHLARLYEAYLAEGRPPLAEFEAPKQAAEDAERAEAERRDRYTRPLGWIYFIRSGEFVKIGFTRHDVSRRVHHIRTAAPNGAELLAAYPGHIRDEASLHRRFQSLRHRAEWFRHEGALAEFIAGLPK